MKPRWSPGPGQAILRRQGHTPVADVPTVALATDPETAPYLSWAQLQHHLSLPLPIAPDAKGSRRSHIPCVSQVKGPQILSWLGTLKRPLTAPACFRHRLGAPGGKPANRGLTVDSETALKLGLRWTPSWPRSINSPADLGSCLCQWTSQQYPVLGFRAFQSTSNLSRGPQREAAICVPGDPITAL